MKRVTVAHLCKQNIPGCVGPRNIREHFSIFYDREQCLLALPNRDPLVLEVPSLVIVPDELQRTIMNVSGNVSDWNVSRWRHRRSSYLAFFVDLDDTKPVAVTTNATNFSIAFLVLDVLVPTFRRANHDSDVGL